MNRTTDLLGERCRACHTGYLVTAPASSGPPWTETKQVVRCLECDLVLDRFSEVKVYPGKPAPKLLPPPKEEPKEEIIEVVKCRYNGWYPLMREGSMLEFWDHLVEVRV